MPTKKSVKRSMSDDHKASLAQGRTEGRAVRDYLEALAAHAPKRGRRRTVESVDRRLAAIEDELGTADAVARLKLVQERRDLQTERETLSVGAWAGFLAGMAIAVTPRKREERNSHAEREV